MDKTKNWNFTWTAKSSEYANSLSVLETGIMLVEVPSLIFYHTIQVETKA